MKISKIAAISPGVNIEFLIEIEHGHVIHLFSVLGDE